MKAAVPLCIALGLTASANAQDLPAQVDLDCDLGFTALLAAIHAKPNPRVYEDATETAIQVPVEHAWYTVTKPGHYAYPAIVVTQFDVGQHGTITHAHCGWGNPEGLARLLQDFRRRDIAHVTDGPAPRGRTP